MVELAKPHMIQPDSNPVATMLEQPKSGIEHHRWLPPAVTFCALTFVLSWIFWLSAMLVDQRMTVHLNFLHLHLNVSIPVILSLAGVLVPGVLGSLLGFLTRWRFFPNPLRRIRPRKSVGYLYLLAVVSPGVIAVTAFSLAPDLSSDSLATLHLADLARLLLINFLLGPFWEECGWRGCLLPMLASRFGLGRASLFVGLIWGAWHFLLYLGIFHVSFLSYAFVFISVVGMSFSLSVLYTSSGNCLLLPVLFHTAWNEMTAWTAPAGFTHLQAAFSAVALWVLAGLLWLWKRPSFEEI